ncbi:MAG: hypothetical protein WC588_03360 [Candidatus Micrarchaeia archaeon]
MVSLKKYVLCKCGASNFFDFSSDMPIEEITVSARCASCGATVHVSVSALLSAPSSPAQQPLASEPIVTASGPSPTMHEEVSDETKENIEQAVRDLFR